MEYSALRPHFAVLQPFAPIAASSNFTGGCNRVVLRFVFYLFHAVLDHIANRHDANELSLLHHWHLAEFSLTPRNKSLTISARNPEKGERMLSA